jgi:hypothetical protein
MKTAILSILLLCSPAAQAAMPIQVISDADDSVGSRLVYGIKEQIRKSSSLELSLNDSVPRLQARIVTMDQNPKNPGVSTVYSLVVTWNNPAQPFSFFLTQYTGYCGAERINACADTVISKVSEVSDQVIHMLVNKSR